MEVIVRVPGAPDPVGPYSPVVRSGGFVFCAGQIGLSPEKGTLVPGGIEEQTERVLENLSAVLRGAGSSWGKVCMTTIFLTELSNGPIVNKLYERYLEGAHLPARQTVGVKELPMGALVEISLIAEAES